MARGLLTNEEIMELRLNPNVEDVNNNRIIYSEEFKLRFLEEYFSGKKPINIFEDAGFNVKALGNKRIERCSSRWRESNAAGALGEKFEQNDFYTKNENERVMLKRTIEKQKAEIEDLKREIRQLRNMISAG